MRELQDLMHQLITGGFETTTACAVRRDVAAGRTPRSAGRCCAARPDLMANFIEEVLRFDSPVQGLWRRLEVSGRRRRRGDPGRHGGHGALRRREPRPAGVRRTRAFRHRASERQEPRRLRLRQPLLRRRGARSTGDAQLVHDPARPARRHLAGRSAARAVARAELLPAPDEAAAAGVHAALDRRPRRQISASA